MCWPGYLETQVEIACRALASVLTSHAPQTAEWFYVLHLFCSKQQAMNLAQGPRVEAGRRCGTAQHWDVRRLLALRYLNICYQKSPLSVTFTTFKLFGVKSSFARCLPPAEFSRKLQRGWEKRRAGSFPKLDQRKVLSRCKNKF